ncbi:hypothetical protein Tcan_04801 [Toxocara canis]|uniref:Uncharacterized protein n=1 Tax=Toxocara canis TaxID=6265 RepID=A0A0B2VPE0_TOXCA|nr:hypothetical protein Tcan_04801 [Toxocara canis]
MSCECSFMLPSSIYLAVSRQELLKLEPWSLARLIDTLDGSNFKPRALGSNSLLTMGCRLSRRNDGTGAPLATSSSQQLSSEKSPGNSEKLNSSNTAPVIEAIDSKENSGTKIADRQASSEKLSKKPNPMKANVEKHMINHNDSDDGKVGVRETGRRTPKATSSKENKSRETEALCEGGRNASTDVNNMLENMKQKKSSPNCEQPSNGMHRKTSGQRRRRTVERRTRPVVFDPEDDTLFEIPLRMPEIDLSAGIKTNA